MTVSWGNLKLLTFKVFRKYTVLLPVAMSLWHLRIMLHFIIPLPCFPAPKQRLGMDCSLKLVSLSSVIPQHQWAILVHIPVGLFPVLSHCTQRFFQTFLCPQTVFSAFCVLDATLSGSSQLCQALSICTYLLRLVKTVTASWIWEWVLPCLDWAPFANSPPSGSTALPASLACVSQVSPIIKEKILILPHIFLELKTYIFPSLHRKISWNFNL